MAGYKEDIDLSLVRNQITLTNNKNAVILKLHDMIMTLRQFSTHYLKKHRTNRQKQEH